MSDLTIYKQTENHDWIISAYHNEGKVTAYETTVYEPKIGFECTIPYRTTNIDQALAVCEQKADEYTPPETAEEGSEAKKPVSASLYDALFIASRNGIPRGINRWLSSATVKLEEEGSVYYDSSCSSEQMNREQKQCSYVMDSDPARPGMEEMYILDQDNDAYLLQGNKRISIMDLINDGLEL